MCNTVTQETWCTTNENKDNQNINEDANFTLKETNARILAPVIFTVFEELMKNYEQPILSDYKKDLNEAVYECLTNKETLDRLLDINDARTIAFNVISKLEDILEKENITLPDPDREGNTNESAIYGQVYYDLEEEIAGIIKRDCNRDVSWHE